MPDAPKTTEQAAPLVLHAGSADEYRRLRLENPDAVVVRTDARWPLAARIETAAKALLDDGKTLIEIAVRHPDGRLEVRTYSPSQLPAGMALETRDAVWDALGAYLCVKDDGA